MSTRFASTQFKAPTAVAAVIAVAVSPPGARGAIVFSDSAEFLSFPQAQIVGLAGNVPAGGTFLMGPSPPGQWTPVVSLIDGFKFTDTLLAYSPAPAEVAAGVPIEIRWKITRPFNVTDPKPIQAATHAHLDGTILPAPILQPGVFYAENRTEVDNGNCLATAHVFGAVSPFADDDSADCMLAPGAHVLRQTGVIGFSVLQGAAGNYAFTVPDSWVSRVVPEPGTWIILLGGIATAFARPPYRSAAPQGCRRAPSRDAGYYRRAPNTCKM